MTFFKKKCFEMLALFVTFVKTKTVKKREVKLPDTPPAEMSVEEILKEVGVLLDDEKLMEEIGRMAQTNRVPTHIAWAHFEHRRRLYGAKHMRWQSAASFIMFRSRMRTNGGVRTK